MKLLRRWFALLLSRFKRKKNESKDNTWERWVEESNKGGPRAQ